MKVLSVVVLLHKTGASSVCVCVCTLLNVGENNCDESSIMHKGFLSFMNEQEQKQALLPLMKPGQDTT